MNFLWPQYLWSMLAVPLLPALYWLLLRRSQKFALRYSSLGLVRDASRRTWRRYLPPLLVWLACSLLLFAAARPTARVTLPWAKSTIMLAMDVSLSMRVSDIEPTRIAAAQIAAKTFLKTLPRDIAVGLVTFANGAQVAQRTTLDRDALTGAIDGLQMQIGTAVGDALVACLAELFPDQGISLGDMTFGSRRLPLKGSVENHDPPAQPTLPFKPVAPGSYDSAAIILLTDGRRTTGIDTLEAAKMVADRGVRVYVIGLGTVDGKVGSDDGMAIYMQLDEPTLREVARITGGEYHHAGTADDLRSVYERLGSRLQVQTRETELTALFALAAAGLVVVAAGLSMLWFGRVG